MHANIATATSVQYLDTWSQRSQRKNGWSCCSPFIVSICYRTALTPPTLQCRYISISSVTCNPHLTQLNGHWIQIQNMVSVKVYVLVTMHVANWSALDILFDNVAARSADKSTLLLHYAMLSQQHGTLQWIFYAWKWSSHSPRSHNF